MRKTEIIIVGIALEFAFLTVLFGFFNLNILEVLGLK